MSTQEMLSAVQSWLPKSLRVLARSTNRNTDQFTAEEPIETRQWLAIRDREIRLGWLGQALDPILEVLVLFEWLLWLGGCLNYIPRSQRASGRPCSGWSCAGWRSSLNSDSACTTRLNSSTAPGRPARSDDRCYKTTEKSAHSGIYQRLD